MFDHYDISSFMKIAVLILICLLCFPCIAFCGDDWDKWDKIFFGSLLVIHSIDTFQTYHIFNNPAYYEKNYIIRKGVSKRGKIFIPIYFLGYSSIEYFVSNKLPSALRKAFLVTLDFRGFNNIKRNHDIGIKMSILF